MAYSATSMSEVWEKGLPGENEDVVWAGPYTYYKLVGMRDMETNAVLRVVIGKFSVKTNHPGVQGTARKRMGLLSYVMDGGQEICVSGSLPAAGLKSVLKLRKGLDDLTLERPATPPFPSGKLSCEHCGALDVKRKKLEFYVEDGRMRSRARYKCEVCGKGFEIERGEVGGEHPACPGCGGEMDDRSEYEFGGFRAAFWCPECLVQIRVPSVGSEQELDDLLDR